MVTNTLAVIDMVAQRALPLFENSNAFLGMIDRQYSDEFAKTGAKIGDSFRIRLPVDYVVQAGPTITGGQNTTETTKTLTVTNNPLVPLQFSSTDLTLKADDFERRYIAPAVNVIAGNVATQIATMFDLIPNLAWNSAGGTMVAPIADTFMTAGAYLDEESVPRDLDRNCVISPLTNATVVSSLKGLFNPGEKITNQYSSGRIMGRNWDANFAMDQTVPIHTNGSFTAGTVNGANQTGTTLTVNAITGTLNAGDIITIAGSYGVNKVNKTDNGRLRQFVVTANAASGATSISIYPAITPPVGGNPVIYQTVTASPANGAAITLVGGANQRYRKNVMFNKNAFTLAMVDLTRDMPGAEVAVRSSDKYSFRVMRQASVLDGSVITRLEGLFGFTSPRPEWACIVADPI